MCNRIQFTVEKISPFAVSLKLLLFIKYQTGKAVHVLDGDLVARNKTYYKSMVMTAQILHDSMEHF